MSQNNIQFNIAGKNYQESTITPNNPQFNPISQQITSKNYVSSVPISNYRNYSNQPVQYMRQATPFPQLYVNNYQVPQVQVYSNQVPYPNQSGLQKTQFRYEQQNVQATHTLQPSVHLKNWQEQQNVQIQRPSYYKKYSTKPEAQLGKNYAPQTDPVEMDRNKNCKLCLWILAALLALLCITIGVIIGLGLILGWPSFGPKLPQNNNNNNGFVVSDIKPKIMQLGNTSFQMPGQSYTSFMRPLAKIQPIDGPLNQTISVVNITKNSTVSNTTKHNKILHRLNNL